MPDKRRGGTSPEFLGAAPPPCPTISKLVVKGRISCAEDCLEGELTGEKTAALLEGMEPGRRLGFATCCWKPDGRTQTDGENTNHTCGDTGQRGGGGGSHQSRQLGREGSGTRGSTKGWAATTIQACPALALGAQLWGLAGGH